MNTLPGHLCVDEHDVGQLTNPASRPSDPWAEGSRPAGRQGWSALDTVPHHRQLDRRRGPHRRDSTVLVGVMEGCQLHDAQVPLVRLAGPRPQQGRHTLEDGTQAAGSCAVRACQCPSKQAETPAMAEAWWWAC